jgi:polar amino acid transport system substrate-binding protein
MQFLRVLRLSSCLLACAALLAAPRADAAPTALQAVTEDLPPLNLEEDGQAAGYSTELLQAMLAQAGLHAGFAVMPWARAYRTALDRPNTIVYSMVRTHEREPLFTWIGPISKRRIYLFRLKERSDIRIRTLGDAHRYRIGVVHQMAATKSLQAAGFSYRNELDEAPNDESNVRKLFAHRVDVILALDWSAYWYAARLGRRPQDLVPVLLIDDTHSYYFGLNPGSSPDIAKRLDAALQRLRADGTVERLARKYLGP